MKIKSGQASTCNGSFFYFFRHGKVPDHQPGQVVRGLTLGLGIGFLASATGCVGWVDGGGYDGGAVVVAPAPDLYFYGDYGGRRDWHGDSHRGAESRGAAHHGGEHGGGGRH